MDAGATSGAWRPSWLAEAAGLDLDLSTLPAGRSVRPYRVIGAACVAAAIAVVAASVAVHLPEGETLDPQALSGALWESGGWLALPAGVVLLELGRRALACRYELRLGPPFVELRWRTLRSEGGFRDYLERYTQLRLRTFERGSGEDGDTMTVWAVELVHSDDRYRNFPLCHTRDEPAARARLAQAVERLRLPALDEALGTRIEPGAREPPVPRRFRFEPPSGSGLAWREEPGAVVASLAPRPYGRSRLGKLALHAFVFGLVLFSLASAVPGMVVHGWPVVAVLLAIILLPWLALLERRDVAAGPRGLELRRRWPWGVMGRRRVPVEGMDPLVVARDRERGVLALAVVDRGRTRFVGHGLDEAALEHLRDGLRAAMAGRRPSGSWR